MGHNESSIDDDVAVCCLSSLMLCNVVSVIVQVMEFIRGLPGCMEQVHTFREEVKPAFIQTFHQHNVKMMLSNESRVHDGICS